MKAESLFLNNVPIGKQTFIVSFVGYETITLSNINVTAGKEVLLNIGLIENLESLDEVIITAEKKERKNS